MDYSKWDKLDVSDDDDDARPKSALPAATSAASKQPVRSPLIANVSWNQSASNLLTMPRRLRLNLCRRLRAALPLPNIFQVSPYFSKVWHSAFS